MSIKKDYDDLIAEATNLGLSEGRELNKISESELKKMINSAKNKLKVNVSTESVLKQNPPKHDYFRG